MNKSWETFEIGMSDLKCKGNIGFIVRCDPRIIVVIIIRPMNSHFGDVPTQIALLFR